MRFSLENINILLYNKEKKKFSPKDGSKYES